MQDKSQNHSVIKLKKQVVVVTGASGFLGRHLSRACADAGYTTVGIGHNSWDANEWQKWGITKWYESEVTVGQLSSRINDWPSIIFHCAGSNSVSYSMTNPSADFDRTVVATRELLEYVRLYCPTTKVVLPSSAAIYGVTEEIPISINANAKPASPYGVNKLIAEQLCISYAKHFGLKVSIARLFSLYGIGLRRQFLWDACTKLSNGNLKFSGTGEETRDWIHVNDAAQLLITLGQYVDKDVLIINGGTGKAHSTKHIAQSIAKALDIKTSPTFSGISRPGDPPHLVASLAGMEKLKWNSTADLKSEIINYVDWYKRVAL